MTGAAKMLDDGRSRRSVVLLSSAGFLVAFMLGA
jgi:hypothetical protein